MRKHILLVIVLIVLVQGCTTGPGEVQNPTEPPPVNPTQAVPAATPPPQLPSMTPLEWINSQPVLEAPTGQAILALNGFPEGYEPENIEYQIAPLPSSGLEVQITQVTYERAIDGQVYTKDSVKVLIAAHQVAEARAEHLVLLVGSNTSQSWEYQQVSGHLVARYHSESGDGRIWISGPYMIAIWSSLDITVGEPALDPLVDIFAALYLELYPAD